MKVVNKENGIETIYVQIKDLGELILLNSSISTEIIQKIYMTFLAESQKRYDEYIKFSDPEMVEFLKGEDVIVDYREISKLSETDINILIKINKARCKQLQGYINVEGQKFDYDAAKENQQLHYQIKDYLKILHHKKGLPISLPLIPDEENVTIITDNSSSQNNYQASISLEPNILLVYRKDGKPLTQEDTFSPILINSAIKIAAVQNDYTTYTTSKRWSEDRKYLIIELNPSQEETEKASQNRVKRYLKTLFPKK